MLLRAAMLALKAHPRLAQRRLQSCHDMYVDDLAPCHSCTLFTKANTSCSCEGFHPSP